MTEKDWIHLLGLLQDESPRVREAVRRRLHELGHDPLAALDATGLELNPRQRAEVAALRREFEAERLEEGWESWWAAGCQDLEQFHLLVSTLLSEYGGHADPRELLDERARRYLSLHVEPELETLVPFLFGPDRMQGDVDDYFAPRNSSLVHCLEQGRGLPITLASILILVGRRVGVAVDGVAFPGHFLARGRCSWGTVWVDCFDDGRFIARDELIDALASLPASVRDHVLGPASPLEICARVLRNAVSALEKAEDVPRWRQAEAWLSELDGALRRTPPVMGGESSGGESSPGE